VATKACRRCCPVGTGPAPATGGRRSAMVHWSCRRNQWGRWSAAVAVLAVVAAAAITAIAVFVVVLILVATGAAGDIALV
jgi:hypothetical protein